MSGIWAVALHTIARCIRMKTAIVFIVLLAGLLLVLPLTLTGDSTLTGRVQTFLYYSVAAASILLSIFTLFVSIGAVAADITGKQIFLLVTKPLARWKYLLGRWIGVVLLDAVLLMICGITVYLTAQHLRTTKAMNAPDRTKLEIEVFTARKSASPVIRPSVEDRTETAFESLKNDKPQMYNDAIKGFCDQKGVSVQVAAALVKRGIENGIIRKLKVAQPGQTLEWNFEDVDVPGVKDSKGNVINSMSSEEYLADGTVRNVSEKHATLFIKSNERFVSRMVQGSIVRVNEMEMRVVGATEKGGGFGVKYDKKAYPSLSGYGFSKGAKVEIVLEPSIQLSYRMLAPGLIVQTRSLICGWDVMASDGRKYRWVRTSPVSARDSLSLPAWVALPDGKLTIRYTNLNIAGVKIDGFQTPEKSTNVSINPKTVFILYRVGSFGWNLFRAFALIFCGLAFLASLGIFFGTFLSFGVASLVAFGVLPFTLAREFLIDAIGTAHGTSQLHEVAILAKGIFYTLRFLLPDLTNLLPSEQLVDGMYISWSHVGMTAIWMLLVRVGLTLAVACFIFQRRELARVQV